MKILGFLRENYSTLAILGITTVSCIALLTRPPVENTSVESISNQEESLDLMVRTKDAEELHLRVTGRNTTEVLKNLKQILKSMEKRSSVEKS